jgi:hypothetical protein
MKKVVGRVVVKESQRGVPDLIVNVVGTKNGETTVKRLGAVMTDAAGDFSLDTDKMSGFADLISVQVIVAAATDGGGSAPRPRARRGSTRVTSRPF